MNEAPPPQTLWELINAHAIARCLHLVAEAGVADALDQRPTSAADLAARTGLNADALARILRLLSAHGVFASGADGYTHTEASSRLRGDHPESLRSFARMIGMPVIWRSFTELAHAARTGAPVTDYAGLVAYFSDHPDEASLFNRAMADKSGSIVPAVVDSYDFSAMRTLADVGGGRGHLVQAVLAKVPTATGILFDLPHVIADAGGVASDRLRLVGGDFFRDPLPSADAYVMMEVLHDWVDADALRILSAVRRAAPKHARLLIVEALIAEQPGPQFGKHLDVLMLAITGGRERTASEFQRLLASAGFRLERVLPTPSPYFIVEAAPV